MPIYLVEIATGNIGHNYFGLWQALSNIDAQRCFDASWLVDTNQDLQTITAALSSHCATGDGLFLVELSNRTRWSGTGLSEEAQAWIAERTVNGKLLVKSSGGKPP